MREAVGFSRGPLARERKDRALPDKVGGRSVFVQVCEDWGEFLARMQLHRGLRIFGVHVHHKVSVGCKERHLTLRIAPIGAMCIALDEFTDREAIRCFFGGDADVFSHNLVSLIYRRLFRSDNDHARIALGSRNASIPYWPYSRPTPKYLNLPQGACGSSVILLITTRPARICEAIRRARWRSVPRTAAWRPYLESLAILIASSSES